MSGVTTATAGLLAHRVSGQGPPVLLLNGGLMSMSAWDPVAAPLEARHRVVRCDFRGQLLTPGPPPSTLEGHAAAVAALLDHLGIERAAVAGTSFGGLVAIRLAAAWPERVAALAVLTATDRVPAGTDEAALADKLRKACRAAADGGDGGLVLDTLAPHTFSPAWVAAEAGTYLQRRRQVAALPSGWFRNLEALLAVLEGLDLRSDLARIHCPALVVGAELDRTFPLARSRALAAALPGATLEVVEGAGHAVVVEAPARVAALLEAFLARVGREGEPS